MHELILFPSFAVSSELETCSLGSKRVKEMKAKKIADLKKCLAAGDKLATQTKYFIILPTNAAHGNYHPTSVQEVKHALRHYVLHLFPDPTDRPSESNRAYYPTSTCGQ